MRLCFTIIILIVFCFSCQNDGKEKSMSNEVYLTTIVKNVSEHQSLFLQECRYRDGENMTKALLAINQLMEEITASEELNTEQKQKMLTYQSEVVTKFEKVTEILAKPMVHTEEFTLAMSLLDESVQKSEELFN